MTQAKQDADETRFVRAMVDALPLKLSQEPEKQKPPKPDFRMTLAGGKRVAVEIVEATDEALRRGYDGAVRRIVYQVTDGMKQRGLRANVGLSFPLGFVAALGTLPGKRQRAISARILDLVSEAVPLLVGHSEGVLYEDPDPDRRAKVAVRTVGDLSSRGITYLDWIVVHRWGEAVVITAVGGKAAGRDLIQSAINDKAVVRAVYDMTGMDAFWLLVVGSTSNVGGLGVNVTANHTFTSPFDKTIFLDWADKRCAALATAPPNDE